MQLKRILPIFLKHKDACIWNAFLGHTIHSPGYYERRTKAITKEGLNVCISRAGSFGRGTYCVRPPKDGSGA